MSGKKAEKMHPKALEHLMNNLQDADKWIQECQTDKDNVGVSIFTHQRLDLLLVLIEELDGVVPFAQYAKQYFVNTGQSHGQATMYGLHEEELLELLLGIEKWLGQIAQRKKPDLKVYDIVFDEYRNCLAVLLEKCKTVEALVYNILT